MDLEKVGEYVSCHRRQAIAIAAAAAVALGGLGFAASSGAFTAQPEAKVEEKQKDKNIEANPNADKAKDESDKAQNDAKVDEAPVETPADKPADNSNASAQNDDAPASKPSNNGNGNSNGSSNQSASKPAEKPSQPAKPAHSHSWKNHTATKQVWVSNWVEEPVYETQNVKVGLTFICNCGFTATDAIAIENHGVQHIINGEPDNYQAVPRYEQQTVQVGTNKVDKGHYETQSYTDYQYCDCGATR